MQGIGLPNKFEVTKITDTHDAQSPNHSHPYYEMIYVKKANFNYFIDNELYHIKNRDIVLINKNTIHKAIFKNSPKRSYYVIKFHEDLVAENLRTALIKLFQKKRICINSDDYFLTDMLFSKLYHECLDKKDGWETLAKFQINEIIVILNRFSVKTNPDSEKLWLKETKEIIDYLNDNISAPISELSLEKLSNMFSITPSHLSRLFKKQIGLGFKEYVISSKILNAKNLLVTTNLSITEIAYRCGFGDSNYFSTVFKKTEGVAPTIYAKFYKSN